jgi:hypothetical protein
LTHSGGNVYHGARHVDEPSPYPPDLRDQFQQQYTNSIIYREYPLLARLFLTKQVCYNFPTPGERADNMEPMMADGTAALASINPHL